MRQNRSRVISKEQKNIIDSLKNNLLQKINKKQSENIFERPITSNKIIRNTFYSPCQDLDIISFDPQRKSNNLLEKAKLITNSHKAEIQRTKKILKKSNNQGQGMFLTGCGLYSTDQRVLQTQQQFEPVDMNDALKYLVNQQTDNLQQLRRMIKKASIDLHEYSEQISQTKNQVMNAADVFNRQLGIDLKIKINKCGFKNQIKQRPESSYKRKISTSHQSRKKNIV